MSWRLLGSSPYLSRPSWQVLACDDLNKNEHAQYACFRELAACLSDNRLTQVHVSHSRVVDDMSTKTL